MRCESSDNPSFSGQEVSKQSSKRSPLSGMSLTFFKEFAIYTIHNHINLIWMKYFCMKLSHSSNLSNYCHKLYVFTLLPFFIPSVSVISFPLHFKQCFFFIPLLFLYWLVLPKFVNFVSFPIPHKNNFWAYGSFKNRVPCFYFIKFLFLSYQFFILSWVYWVIFIIYQVDCLDH